MFACSFCFGCINRGAVLVHSLRRRCRESRKLSSFAKAKSWLGEWAWTSALLLRCRCHVMRARICLCVAHVGVCVLFLYSWCVRAVLVFVVCACCSHARGVYARDVLMVLWSWCCCAHAVLVHMMCVYSWCYSCARGVFMLLWSWWCVCVCCDRGAVVVVL